MIDTAADLLSWIAEDEAEWARLAADGSLFEGYHPEMRATHDRNARRLATLVAREGWPGTGRVGEAAAEAAWRIVQHAIAQPNFQREMLARLGGEAKAGRIPAWQVAYLEDRIAVQEGRPQTYGTQFDWDEAGEMSPRPIADPEAVDRRRAAVGLGPLDEAIRRQREEARDQPRPANPVAWRRAADAWAVKTGWRKP